MLRIAVGLALLLAAPRACLAAPPPAPTPDPAASGRHAVVLGAGFSGLTAALELRALGYAVTVLDRLPAPGGRAQRLREPGGFTFDTGPSWYWMPEVFDTVFARYGSARERHYNLTRLDPAYRLLLPAPAPGAPLPPPLDVPGTLPDFQAMADALDPANALRAFLADAEAKYRLGVDSAIWQAPGPPLAPWMLSRAVHPNLVLRNLRQHIAAYTAHPTLRAVLEWPSQFLGMDAGATPSLYALLSWSGHAQGTWLPSRGGMAAPALALHALAAARGVRFEFCTEVTALEAAGRYVVTRVGSRPSSACSGSGADSGADAGAGAAPTTWRAVDAVVASGDYEFIEQTLLPASLRRHSPQYWAAVAMTPNVITFRLCVTAPVPVLTCAHTLLLEDADMPFYASSYGTVEEGEGEGEGAGDGGGATPPAPRNGTSVFVLVPLLNASAPTPPHDVILARVLARLRLTHADLACGASGYGPSNYSADYHAFRGNAFGLANTLGQTMWLKPPMESLAVNLVFAGHLTHPGPGVPPALVSGIVAARALHAALAPAPTLRELAPALAALALLLLLGALAHTPAVTAALALHRGGKTYFAAACAMPYANFAAIARLYAILREADDLVDCSHADADTRARDIAACEARILATPASRLGHAPALWASFFAAMRADTAAGGTACATLRELTAYMDGSAAVLGEFLLPALGGAPALARPARALGYAFQLTNMLRDVVEDGGLGRRYVPAEAVVAAGFPHGDPAAAAAHPADPRFRALMEAMFKVADAWYAQADAGIAALPPHTRPAIALARTTYHRLHDGIRAAGYALVPRVVIPWWRKLLDAGAVLPASGIASVVGGELAARVLGGAALGALPAAALLALALALTLTRPPPHHEVTYAEVHTTWTLPLLAALLACAAALRFAWRGRAAHSAYSGHASDAAMAPKWAALLAGVAYAYTTPWDAHLIARGVWASTAVGGAALGVPLEELAFFGLAVGVGVGAWLCVWPLRWADVAGGGAGAGAGAARAGAPGAGAALGALGAAGLALAALGPPRAYYLGALLAWACPVLALQAWVGGGVLWAQRGPLARAVALSGGALAMVDAWAIKRNVWVLSPSFSLPAWGAGWHVEEVAFFFLTAGMCCGGLTLALWAEHGFLPRMRLAGVEVAWGARAAGKGGKAE